MMRSGDYVDTDTCVGNESLSLQVFVWIGSGANDVEKKEALTTAKTYVTTDPSGRDLDSTILYQVRQGFEPITFTCWFQGWDPSKKVRLTIDHILCLVMTSLLSCVRALV